MHLKRSDASIVSSNILSFRMWLRRHAVQLRPMKKHTCNARRKITETPASAPERAAAARELRERAGGGADALIAEMSEANADGQRRATVALLDWFGDAA